jgi:hypothetical protein
MVLNTTHTPGSLKDTSIDFHHQGRDEFLTLPAS